MNADLGYISPFAFRLMLARTNNRYRPAATYRRMSIDVLRRYCPADFTGFKNIPGL